MELMGLRSIERRPPTSLSPRWTALGTSVCIERSTQRSSAQPASFGNNSLITTPLESQVFVLDFGGGTFAPLVDLPHVAGVGTRSEPDVVRRIVAEVHGIVDRREAYFRAQGIDSITYR